MKVVEFSKRFITGPLTGLKVVERIVTNSPENWKVGDIVMDTLTDDKSIVEEVIVDDVV